jgi:hypothetical protein
MTGQPPLADGSRSSEPSRAGRRAARVITGIHRRLLSATGGQVLGRMDANPTRQEA